MGSIARNEASAALAKLPVIRHASETPLDAPDDFFTVHENDARRLELLLSPYSSAKKPLLTTTITSPPYGKLKDYGHADQIGYGQPNDEYLLDLRRAFRSISSHTKPNGSMWLVVDTLRVKRKEGEVWPVQLLPFQLAQEAESVGWTLRDVIVWVKDKTLPWSSRGRMRNGFEYILFFVKSPSFKYRVDRLREPDDLEQWWVKYPERYNPQGKAPSNVWAVPIPVQGSWANTTIQHACPLPADLVERMMLLSSDEGDVVFDPFAGSGVVVAEAQRLERQGLGIELVKRNVDAFHSTVLPEITERRGVDEVQERHQQSERLKQTILDLRSVKYPKAIFLTARRIDPNIPRPHAIYMYLRRSKSSRKRLALDMKFVLKQDDLDRAQILLDALAKASRRSPVSKYGIDSTSTFAEKAEIPSLHRGRRLWAYVDGRTNQAIGKCTVANIEEFAGAKTRFDIPVIVSNVYVNERPRRLTKES